MQLPDVLLEVDAATHFSEELLERRAGSSDELFALYGAFLAHGTDNDAKGVGTMIPGIDVAQIAAAMRALEHGAGDLAADRRAGGTHQALRDLAQVIHEAVGAMQEDRRH